MKVLLTGGTGFLGRYVRHELGKRGIRTVLVGRARPSGQPDDFITCDLLDRADLARAVEAACASHLLHLAWYTEHGKFWEAKENLQWLRASVDLVDAFGSFGGRRMVIAGTCAEYDWSDGRCLEASTPLQPTMLYGVTKDATRRIAEALCRSNGAALAWARIFFNYGTGEPAARLVPSIIAALRGTATAFSVDLAAQRDFLHASDIARGLVTLLEAPDTGAFNVCSGVATRVSEVVSTLGRLMGADTTAMTALNAAKPGQPRTIVGSNSKLKSLGWHQQLSLEEGLALVLRETT